MIERTKNKEKFLLTDSHFNQLRRTHIYNAAHPSCCRLTPRALWWTCVQLCVSSGQCMAWGTTARHLVRLSNVDELKAAPHWPKQYVHTRTRSCRASAEAVRSVFGPETWIVSMQTAGVLKLDKGSRCVETIVFFLTDAWFGTWQTCYRQLLVCVCVAWFNILDETLPISTPAYIVCYGCVDEIASILYITH